jgi:hypothetical protein
MKIKDEVEQRDRVKRRMRERERERDKAERKSEEKEVRAIERRYRETKIE